MTIAGANGQLIDFFQWKCAFRKCLVLESIDEEKFVVGLAQECALYRKRKYHEFGF